MATQLFIAYVEAVDGSTLAGPVTVDKNEYLFVNKNSALDIYFNLRKTESGWQFSGGPSTPPPQRYVEAVGAQIDEYSQPESI